MHVIPIATIAILASVISPAYAKNLTITELMQECKEIDKAARGIPFDEKKAEYCRGYMQAFFDSMLIVDQYAAKPQLCIPRSAPTTANTAIIKEWIKKNTSLAPTTTASVALFAAYKTAYPCN